MSSIWEKIKGFCKEVYYFFTSKIFWKNFGKQVAIVLGVLAMLFWGLKCCTNHGEAIKVPNYVGKNMKEVLRMLDDEGFTYTITDSVFIENQTPDIVLEQNPAANSYVKTGRTIYLKITKAAGDLVTLPGLDGGDDINYYTEVLKSIGVRVGKIDTIEDANLSDGTIKEVVVHGRNVYDDLPKGVKVPQGSLVNFVITKRVTNTTDVPPFINDGTYSTVEEYKLILESSFLTIGNIIKDGTVTDESSAFVIKVSPGVRFELDKGSSVTIYVTQQNPAKIKIESFD